MVRRKYGYRRRDGRGRFDGLYHLYCADFNVLDDAFHGLLQSSRAMACVKRVNEILDVEIDLTDERSLHPDLFVKEGRIEFKDVFLFL